MVATAVAVVPPVRHAVHQATRKAPVRQASAPNNPNRKVAQQRTAASRPCAPGLENTDVPPLAVTEAWPTDFADAIDPAQKASNAAVFSGGGAPGVGVSPIIGGGGGGGGSSGGVVVDPGTETPTAPVPEPATWGLMILGFGLAGAAMRSRWLRRRVPLWVGVKPVSMGKYDFTLRAGIAGTAWGALMPLQANSKGAAMLSKSAASAILTKTALCVCPTAMLAVGAMNVPAVTKAVNAATAPQSAVYQKPTQTAISDVPCEPVVAARDVEVSEPTSIASIGSAGPSLAAYENKQAVHKAFKAFRIDWADGIVPRTRYDEPRAFSRLEQPGERQRATLRATLVADIS